MLIVVMLVAGVATVFAKTDKTTPAATNSRDSVTAPLVEPSANTSVKSIEPAPTNSLKKSPVDELANAPLSPDTGVPSYPIGFVFVGAAVLIGTLARRAARA